MEQKPPDYLMITFSVMTMVLTVLIAWLFLCSCSLSYHKDFADIEGKQASTTEFTITTKS